MQIRLEATRMGYHELCPDRMEPFSFGNANKIILQRVRPEGFGMAWSLRRHSGLDNDQTLLIRTRKV